MYHFFAMLSRMKYINRWGLMRNTREENLCEHSLEVALAAHALATSTSAEATTLSGRRCWPCSTMPRKLSPGTCPPR